MLKQGKLLRYGGYPFAVRRSECIDSNTASEVKIFFTVTVRHNGAFSADDFHGKAGVGMCNKIRIKLFCIHSFCLLTL